MSDLVHIAQQLAHTVEKTAVAKDSAGQQLNEEVEKLKESGILAATVPQRLGGPETQPTDIAEIFRLLGTADGSFAQIPQSHFVFSRWLFSGEKPEEEDKWAQRLLDGALIANAQAELGEPTLLHKDGEHFLLKGEKHFGISVLTENHAPVVRQLAGPKDKRFANIGWHKNGEAVLLEDSAAHLTTQLIDEIDTGDHILALLEVKEAEEFIAGLPLVFHGSQITSVRG